MDVSRRRGQTLGRLAGLPLLVKDNIDTKDLPTTAGTPGLLSNRPGEDAPVLSPLFREGALLFAKANLHELAEGPTGHNYYFGAVRNPYDPTMISGGSSAGTGAGIAARLCPAGLGTDTVGSVRVPAALCGVVGLRPTKGLYPISRIFPISHTLRHRGADGSNRRRRGASRFRRDGDAARAGRAGSADCGSASRELRSGKISIPRWRP